jgi:hypothetical protein
MYEEDSFFSLSTGGQIGLLCLSISLTLLVLFVAARLMRGRSLVVRIGLGVIFFGLFVWLSPQVYYTYYRMIFDGLPAQWVIGWPPFDAMFDYASFSGPQNLSAHGQGVLFWMLVILALWGSMRRGPEG